MGIDMRRSVIAVVVILFIATVYLCVYAFQQSIDALNRYRECAERSEVLQALSHLTTSALYLLFSVLMLLIIGIVLYVLFCLLMWGLGRRPLEE
jgi:hypothetical protein